jgi:hypothetical protein
VQALGPGSGQRPDNKDMPLAGPNEAMAHEAQMEDWFTRQWVHPCMLQGRGSMDSGRRQRETAQCERRRLQRSGRSLPILGAWLDRFGVDNAFYGRRCS